MRNVVHEKMTKELTSTCPCCGWPGLDSPAYVGIGKPPWASHGQPPYETKYGMPSYEVCACCGFEFGNDDNPGTAKPDSFGQYLSRWIAEGCKWFCEDEKPKDWNLETQLNRAKISKT